MTSVRFPVVTAQECLNLKQIVETEERTRERFLRAVDNVHASSGNEDMSPLRRSPPPPVALSSAPPLHSSPTPSKISHASAKSGGSSSSKRKKAPLQPNDSTVVAGPAEVPTSLPPAGKAASAVGSAVSASGSKVATASRVSESVFSRGSSSMVTNPSSRLPASQASKMRAIGQRLSRLEETVDEGLKDDHRIEESLSELKKIITNMKQL